MISPACAAITSHIFCSFVWNPPVFHSVAVLQLVSQPGTLYRSLIGSFAGCNAGSLDAAASKANGDYI